MLLERSEISVRSGAADAFAAAMRSPEGLPWLRRVPGVLSVQMGRGVEAPDKFVLLVGWADMAAHDAFRTAPGYPDFLKLFAPHSTGGAMEHFAMEDAL